MPQIRNINQKALFSFKYITYLERPAVLFGRLSQLADGRGKVRGEGSVDVRLQFREVDLDELIVLASAVWRQELTLVFFCLAGDAIPAELCTVDKLIINGKLSRI